MPSPNLLSSTLAVRWRFAGALVGLVCACGLLLHIPPPVAAQQASDRRPASSSKPASTTQAELDAALVEMLSGATLEGSFTDTAPGSDPTDLSRERYTLGEVQKLAGNLWLFPARIEYGDNDVTLPITLPVQWAGDTPLVVVDSVGLPGFGTVSARVMFFDGHYAGYWKHGKRSGHLFGTIRQDDNQPAVPGHDAKHRDRPSRIESPANEQGDQQRGK